MITRDVERRSAFERMGIWPPNRVHSSQWLRNFLPNEEPFALALLNQLLFFGETMTDRLFAAGLRQLRDHVAGTDDPAYSSHCWRQFRKKARFIGLGRTDGASGKLFSRKCRRLLELDEASTDPREVAQDCPLVLVDDFIGSGDQLLEELQSPLSGIEKSPEDLAREPGRVSVVVAIAHQQGLRRLREHSPNIAFFCGQEVGPENSVHEDANWPKELRSTWRTSLEAISSRVGIPQADACGHRSLGLVLAFDHGTPDASIPILYTETESWRKLVRRR